MLLHLVMLHPVMQKWILGHLVRLTGYLLMLRGFHMIRLSLPRWLTICLTFSPSWGMWIMCFFVPVSIRIGWCMVMILLYLVLFFVALIVNMLLTIPVIISGRMARRVILLLMLEVLWFTLISVFILYLVRGNHMYGRCFLLW